MIWECEVMQEPEKVLNRIISHIGRDTDMKAYDMPSRRELLRVAEKKLQYSLNQIEKNKTLSGKY